MNIFVRLEEYYLHEPKRLVQLGASIMRIAMAWAFVGLAGYIVRTAISFPYLNTAKENRGLSEIFPAFPTWWIPESVSGFVAVGALFLLGIAVRFTGLRLQKMYRKFY